MAAVWPGAQGARSAQSTAICVSFKVIPPVVGASISEAIYNGHRNNDQIYHRHHTDRNTHDGYRKRGRCEAAPAARRLEDCGAIARSERIAPFLRRSARISGGFYSPSESDRSGEKRPSSGPGFQCLLQSE